MIILIMNKFHFTTILSQDHLFKFLAMFSSLKANHNDFKIFVLCVNDIVWHILNRINIAEVIPIMLKEVEGPMLERVKNERPFQAFCWTLKPVFLHYIMNNYTECKYFAHLDADLFFFSSLDEIFNENPEANLYLTHHRNARDFLQYYRSSGVFNTGFVGCKNNKTAQKAVSKWEEQCLLECPIAADPVRKLFGDQRYVESWPDTYDNVHIVRSLGVNTALWNIQNYNVIIKDEKIYINDHPLVFYHFSGLTIISRDEFNLNWYYYIDDKMVLNYIYMPYVVVLNYLMQQMQEYFPWFISGFLSKEYTPDTHYLAL